MDLLFLLLAVLGFYAFSIVGSSQRADWLRPKTIFATWWKYLPARIAVRSLPLVPRRYHERLRDWELLVAALDIGIIVGRLLDGHSTWPLHVKVIVGVLGIAFFLLLWLVALGKRQAGTDLSNQQVAAANRAEHETTREMIRELSGIVKSNGAQTVGVSLSNASIGSTYSGGPPIGPSNVAVPRRFGVAAYLDDVPDVGPSGQVSAKAFNARLARLGSPPKPVDEEEP